MGAKKKSFEELEIRGHTVHIVRTEIPERLTDNDESAELKEEVYIDGRKISFLKSDDGYSIAYDLPYDTLSEAVESYLANTRFGEQADDG